MFSIDLPSGGTDLAISVLYIVVYGVGVPLTVASFVILRKHWDSYYFVKRNRRVVVTVLLCLAVYLLVSIFFQTEPWFSINVYGKFLFLTFVTFFCVYTIFGMLILRIWLFYFKSKLIDIEKNRNWRLGIDPIKELEIDQINWYFNYQKRFGNSKHLYKWTMILSILQSILTNVFLFLGTKSDIETLIKSGIKIDINHYNFDLFKYIELTIISLSFAFYGIMAIYFGLRLKYYVKFDDTFGIKHELIYESALLILFVISGIIIYVSSIGEVAITIFSCIVVILYTIFMYLIVLYPKIFYINRQENEIRKQMKKNANYYNFSTKSEKKKGNKGKKRKKKIKNDELMNMPLLPLHAQYSMTDYDWIDIVGIYDGYEAFMNHLESEFSFENLLFVHEYMHIKMVLQQFFGQIMAELAMETKLAQFSVELPPIVKYNPSIGFTPALIPKQSSQDIIVDINDNDNENENEIDEESNANKQEFGSPNVAAYNKYVETFGFEPENATQLVLFATNNNLAGVNYKRARQLVSNPPQNNGGNTKDETTDETKSNKSMNDMANETNETIETIETKEENDKNEAKEEKIERINTFDSTVEPLRGLFKSDSNDNRQQKMIAESNIAQLLRLALSNIIKLAKKHDLSEINNDYVDNVGKRICMEIIKAFKLLYNKYMDDNGAIFLVYVSNNNLNQMKNLFGNFNFFNRRKHNKLKGRKETNTSNEAEAKKKSTLMQNNMFDTLNTLFRASKVEQTIIEQELKDMLEMENDNDNLKNRHMFKWILTKIIIAIEPSLLETSTLLTDSFQRFKINQNTLFEKLSIYVTNHKKMSEASQVTLA